MNGYRHKTRGHPSIKQLLAFVLTLIVLVATTPPDLAKADAIEHTHIWADKYDSSNHWKYCTVCGAVKDKETHTFTDHWAYGYESCNVNNSDTKTCSCGYSYVYHKPHEIDYSKIAERSKSRRYHSYGCKNCGLTTAVGETCTHNGKPITCQNYGACDVCGLIYTQDEAHNVTTSTGTCAVCGKRIYTVVGSNFTYSSDYKKGQFEFRVIPGENVEISSIYWYSFYANGVFTDTDVTNSGTGMYNTGKGYTLDSDGKTRIYRWNFSFTKYNSAYYYLCMSTKIGDAYYHNEGMAYFTICQDREAPIISEIKQTDQASSNGWATIKQLNISGTENVTKYVTLSISDKSTEKKLIDAAKLVVSNNSWSYECTPPLEGDVNGRTYICKVVDDNGNTSTNEFTIYKTDGTSPQIESPLSYTDWTNTVKTITLTFTDYGSGDVQASLDNQTSYKACTKTADGKYQITYTFSDDIIGNKTYKLYLRDGLGNAGSYDLVVGNIDKNTYSITYNLNSGTMSGQKTSYTVADSFTLPQPTKTGYTFIGWTGSNGTTPQKTVTVNKGTRGNLSYTANWSANSYENGINHWVWGFKNGEGNNTSKNAFHLLPDTSFKITYGNIFVLNEKNGTRVPNGFCLRTSFGTGSVVNGAWKIYNFNTSITQKAGQMYFEYDYDPISYSITYNLNGGTNNSSNPSTYNVLYGVSLKAPTRAGYTFTGWHDESGNIITGINEGCNATFSSADDLYAKLTKRTTGNRTLTAHWSYNPVSIKVPQVLTGDHTGKSQFRVKCDDFKAGNIKIIVPNSFLYKQAGKADVTATITAKSGNNIITPTNKVCVYNITTKNGLSAGCWSGNFNIGLTLTKE